MPSLSLNELQDLVDDADLGAVSIDTNIFHRLSYNLESQVLREVAQFPAHGIRHLVTDVVAGEVRTHMIAAEEQAKAKLRSALRHYTMVRGRLRAERDRIASEVDLDDDVEVAVYRRWLDFAFETTAEIIDGMPADGAKLIEMYFARTPPFEDKADKKHEFPDAIALLALETAGEAMGKYVLAISDDGGWKRFASTAKWVVALDDLKAAINLLHSADAIAAERALALLANDDAGIRDDVDAAIGKFLDDFYPVIEAESYMEFDAEFEGAKIVAIDPVDPTAATVLASDAETVTLAFEASLDLDVEARFTFQVHDAVDKDYLSMGERTAKQRVTIVLPVTIVVLRGSSEADGAVSVSIEQLRLQTVDFGFVEPSGWQN